MSVPRRHRGNGGIAPFILTPSALILGRNWGTHCIEGCWASEPVWTILKRDVDLLHILKGFKLKRVFVPNFLFFPPSVWDQKYFFLKRPNFTGKQISFVYKSHIFGFLYLSHGPGSNPGADEIFRPFRPALGPTQTLVQWVPGLSLG